MMRSIISLGTILMILFSCKPPPEPIEESPMIQKVDSTKIAYIMGHFNPKEHRDFALIPIELADREGLYLRKEALRAYGQMYHQAKSEGINFQIRSATRNFEYQKGIWERKWTGTTKLSDGTAASAVVDPVDRAKKILLYSSMPSTSRHHWGTDIDLNSFDNDYFKSGQGLVEYNWLLDHAASFGFCQPYTDKSEGRTGYEEERWHWTYTPISRELTNYAEQYLTDDMIQGFMGSETAPAIDVVKNYVLGIHQGCRR